MAFGKKKRDLVDKELQAEEVREADFSALDQEEGAHNSHHVTSDGTAAPTASSEELEKLRKEAADNKDKYLRALAEFENFKKHALKERSELLRYQGERIFVDLLDVVDNFELALQHSKADPEKLRSGVELIYKLLADLLTKWEVRAESGLGKPFDPARFNAISRAEVDDAVPGTIITEFKKTYLYKDKLIRIGDVVVAAERSEPEEQEGPDTDS